MNNLLNDTSFSGPNSSFPSFILKMDPEGTILESKVEDGHLRVKENFLSHINGLDQAYFKEMVAHCQYKEEVQFEFCLKTGKWIRGLLRKADHQEQFVLTGYDISMEKRKERTIVGVQEVLKALASNTKITDVLSQLAVVIEGHLSNVSCSILIYEGEKKFELVASSNLQTKIISAIEELTNHTNSLFQEIVERKISIKRSANFYLQTSMNGCHGIPVLSSSGEVLGVVAIFSEDDNELCDDELNVVSNLGKIAAIAIEKHKKDKELHTLAFFDPLTNLPNRSLMISNIDHAISEFQHTQNRFVLIYIDFDRFKILNDSFGHLGGDQILKALTTKLSTCLSEGDFVARMNGDEFIVLIKNVGEQKPLQQEIQKISDVFKQAYYLGEQELYVTASFGIVEFPKDGADARSLLIKADLACQQAKKEGRNHVQFYQKGLGKNLSNRLNLEKDLRYALERDELILYYQPLVNVVKGRIMGAEALLRWNHPKLGIIPPGEFISILEDTGLIIPIGEWLIQEACRQQNIWVQKGLPALSVSVNISPVQFKSNILVKAVNNALAHSKLNPSFLKLELTENMIVNNIGETLKILNELKHIGIGVSIDDFGTGYSSLSYLKKFPIETIKIDRAFIKEIDYDRQDQAIVKAIIDMGRSLKLDIVAEGTERDRQIHYLREVGCETVQGYFFSRPVPADEFEKQLFPWNKLARELSHQTYSI
ncbi:EAL domain-containing protein [Cytobacillus sp. FJAT-54145]|uniref:EAL domain-containing protein n=1 Tax=Cytobacillus spartinae TaxID=3299023 RepID=A0ABW6KFE7_9BACI